MFLEFLAMVFVLAAVGFGTLVRVGTIQAQAEGSDIYGRTLRPVLTAVSLAPQLGRSEAR